MNEQSFLHRIINNLLLELQVEMSLVTYEITCTIKIYFMHTTIKTF